MQAHHLDLAAVGVGYCPLVRLVVRGGMALGPGFGCELLGGWMLLLLFRIVLLGLNENQITPLILRGPFLAGLGFFLVALSFLMRSSRRMSDICF